EVTRTPTTQPNAITLAYSNTTNSHALSISKTWLPKRLLVPGTNQSIRKLSGQRAEASRRRSRIDDAQPRLQIRLGRSRERRDGLLRFCLFRAQTKRRGRCAARFEPAIRLAAACPKIRGGPQSKGRLIRTGRFEAGRPAFLDWNLFDRARSADHARHDLSRPRKKDGTTRH